MLAFGFSILKRWQEQLWGTSARQSNLPSAYSAFSSGSCPDSPYEPWQHGQRGQVRAKPPGTLPSGSEWKSHPHETRSPLPLALFHAVGLHVIPAPSTHLRVRRRVQ